MPGLELALKVNVLQLVATVRPGLLHNMECNLGCLQVCTISAQNVLLVWVRNIIVTTMLMIPLGRYIVLSVYRSRNTNRKMNISTKC